MKIYIVQGNTGEYSDSRSWNSCAFKSIDKARKHRNKLNNMLRKYGMHTSNILRFNPFKEEAEWVAHCRMRESIVPIMSKIDDKIEIDYTGSEYRIFELELK